MFYVWVATKINKILNQNFMKIDTKYINKIKYFDNRQTIFIKTQKNFNTNAKIQKVFANKRPAIRRSCPKMFSNENSIL